MQSKSPKEVDTVELEIQSCDTEDNSNYFSHQWSYNEFYSSSFSSPPSRGTPAFICLIKSSIFAL